MRLPGVDTRVTSMSLAGGGLRHGQVIGATEKDGGSIKERPVNPGDLAASIYRYFGVPPCCRLHKPMEAKIDRLRELGSESWWNS